MLAKLKTLYKKLAANRLVDRVFWTGVEVGAGLLAGRTLFPNGLAGVSSAQVAAIVAVGLALAKETALRQLSKLGGPVELPSVGASGPSA